VKGRKLKFGREEGAKFDTEEDGCTRHRVGERFGGQ
jgi:hypothetical protein